jgi:FkbH-like protein
MADSDQISFRNMKYAEIMKANQLLAEKLKGKRPYKIRVLSNVVTQQLKDWLEFPLRLEQINAQVSFGEYDNIVQDSARPSDVDAVILFWEAANLISGAQFKVELMSSVDRKAFVNKVKGEIDLVLKNLKSSSLIVFNSFSSAIFDRNSLRPSELEKICHSLNEYVDKLKPGNMVVVDLNKILTQISAENSFDARFFYSSKALYGVDFYKTYVKFIEPLFLSANGRAKKAIIFDCDNTLWKGILGEDGPQNILMSSRTPEGSVFEEVQSIALALSKKGVLLCLCSKNNPQDVDEVLNSHPDMKIKNQDIILKKVNWSDKVTNIKAIADELNIGLDSLVFVDDSDFEVDLVRESLPQVTVLRVPSRLSEYPAMIRENLGLFYNLSNTKEDLKKTEIYKNQLAREREKSKFENVEAYLRSLKIKVFMSTNDFSNIPRIAQLTQKTNQFNLTTKRYTEADIEKFMKDPSFLVFSFRVVDKFDDNGIVGVVILNLRSSLAKVDTFLMSCRVIGRNVELAVFHWILGEIAKQGTTHIEAHYSQTSKNSQVQRFYDKFGFSVREVDMFSKIYTQELSSLVLNQLEYLEVVDVRSKN